MTTETAKTYRVGMLHYIGKDDKFINAAGVAELKTGLARLGYHEARNVAFMERYGDRDLEKTRRFAREMVEWKPDVICTFITNSNLAVKEATADDKIPVVCWATNLIEAGFVQSYRRPGGNFTGVCYEPYYQFNKVRLMKLAVPGLMRLAHLYNPDYPPARPAMREIKAAATLMGLDFKPYETTRREDFAATIAAMKRDDCQAVVVGPHALFNTNGEELGKLFLEAGLPAVGNQLSIARAGGLAAFGSPARRWFVMAELVDRIFKGESPAEIPVDRSSKAPLILNLKSAKSLGLAMPEALVDEADVLLD
jgi:putative ABC transport system substrate-binding protein